MMLLCSRLSLWTLSLLLTMTNAMENQNLHGYEKNVYDKSSDAHISGRDSMLENSLGLEPPPGFPGPPRYVDHSSSVSPLHNLNQVHDATHRHSTGFYAPHTLHQSFGGMTDPPNNSPSSSSIVVDDAFRHQLYLNQASSSSPSFTAHGHHGHAQETSENDYTNEESLDQDIASRSDRLNRYEWQLGLMKDKILQIYATIVPLWGDVIKRTTLLERAEKLGDILEKEPDNIRAILEFDPIKIFALADRTRQVRSTNRGGLRQDKPMSVQEFLEFLQRPSDKRSDNGRPARWAPSFLKSKQRKSITDVLRRTWQVTPFTVRNWLEMAKEVDSEAVENCIPDLLSKDNNRIRKAASILQAMKNNFMTPKPKRFRSSQKHDVVQEPENHIAEIGGGRGGEDYDVGFQVYSPGQQYEPYYQYWTGYEQGQPLYPDGLDAM